MEPLQLRVRSEALAAEKKVAPHAPAPIEFLMWINAKLWGEKEYVYSDESPARLAPAG